MAESNNLGAGVCPIKGCTGTASFSLSKKGLPVATCMACKCQVFSRGEVSDELMRDLIADSKPAPPAPAPAGEKPPAPKPPPPPPTAKKPSWGMLA